MYASKINTLRFPANADGSIFAVPPQTLAQGYGELGSVRTWLDGDRADHAISAAVAAKAVSSVAIPLALNGIVPVNITEGVPVALFAGATISAEADTSDGGLGDFSGYSLYIRSWSKYDEYIIEGGQNFTVEAGSSDNLFNLKHDGKIFGYFDTAPFVDTPYTTFPSVTIEFTSLQTNATSALVDEVLQAILYRNTSDTPPPQAGAEIVLIAANGWGYGFDHHSLSNSIIPVNDAPSIRVSPIQFAGKGEQLVFSPNNGNAISVSDSESETLQVTLGAAHGTLTLVTNAGLTFISGDGIGDATMTVRGTAAAINAALDGLLYRGAFDYRGEDALTLTASDFGGTGIGGAQSSQETIAIILAPNDDRPGTAGDDTLTGTGDPDRFLLGAGGHDHASGGAGSDLFVFGADWDAGDQVDGGDGQDTLQLTGNYDYRFGDNQITGIERVLLVGGPTGVPLDYRLNMADGNLAAGARLLVDARDLVRTEVLTFDATAEQDGSYEVFGGFGEDILTGGAGDDSLSGLNGADRLSGGAGDDRLIGNLGADLLEGGEGADIFVYKSAAESTTIRFDTIVGFDPSEDRVDLPFDLAGGGILTTGALNRETFSADIARATESFVMILFTPDSGDFAGRTFAVIDANGDRKYTAVQDYVIEFSQPTEPLHPLTEIFI